MISLVFPTRDAILERYNINMQEFVDIEITDRLGRYETRIEDLGGSYD